jgi:hypothetical protein
MGGTVSSIVPKAYKLEDMKPFVPYNSPQAHRSRLDRGQEIDLSLQSYYSRQGTTAGSFVAAPKREEKEMVSIPWNPAPFEMGGEQTSKRLFILYIYL